MAQQTLDLAVKGLYTSPSTFADVPQGAVLVADNIVIDRPNLASTRRGFENYGNELGSPVKLVTDYFNVLIAHTAENQLYYDSNNAGSWVAYPGTYSAPDPTAVGAVIRTVQANKNFYFLTNDGTFKLDSITGTPKLAGAPRGQSGSAAATGTTGFLPANTNVAYRVVWGYRDANNNLILGAPSERIIATNTSTTNSANVSISFQIPNEIDSSWFYQIYRSLPSVDTATSPNDELQQCAEGVPTSAELAAATVTFLDSTPASLLQGYLYTNSSQSGILQANLRPPFAKDICFYKNYTFYANTRTTHTFYANLLSSEAPDGLQIGDSLTFTHGSLSFTIVGQAAENAAAGQFKVSTTGNPGVDLQVTAMSIAAAINAYTSNSFLNAYYISNFDETPGKLQFELASLDSAPFYVTTSRPSAWSPTIPTTGTSAFSTNELAPNRIYWSRELQPEAVPVLNWLEVGSKAQGIDRIVPLRDGIIILKQDGVFRLSGSTPDWTVQGLDNSVRILAPNTASLLDNQVYFLSDQGVVAASDSAVQIMSYPIERELLELTSPTSFPNFSNLAFAVTYNADRKYILSLPVTGTDELCNQQFCYNTITNTWTRWTRQTRSGTVFIRDNKIYFGTGTRIVRERKNYTKYDFADEDYAITITAVSGNSFTVADPTTITVGSTIAQGSLSDEVTAISGSTIFTSSSGWSVGSATTYTPIESIVQTIQLDCGNPGKQKHFSEASFIFTTADFTEMETYFFTDINGSRQKQLLKPSKRGGWGQFSWGDATWGGGGSAGQSRIRTLIPNHSARANWLYVKFRLRQCFTSFGLSGLSIIYSDTSTRQRQAGDK